MASSKPTRKGYGLKVDGLAESVRALARLDNEYRKEAVQIFRDVAADVQHRAQGNIGRVGRYPKRRGMIGRSATGTGAAVKLRASKYPWAYGAEYGEQVAAVYGHPYSQRMMKRRTMGIWRPPTSEDLSKNTGGYMIQPVLRARMPHITREASQKMLELIDKAMRHQGVPHGGR